MKFRHTENPTFLPKILVSNLEEDYEAWRTQQIESGKIPRRPALPYDPSKKYVPFLAESGRKRLGLPLSELEAEFEGFKSARAAGQPINTKRVLTVESEIRRLKQQETDIAFSLQQQSGLEDWVEQSYKWDTRAATKSPLPPVGIEFDKFGNIEKDLSKLKSNKGSRRFLTRRNIIIGAGAALGLGILLSRKDKYNEIEGLHPGSPDGIGAQMIRGYTDFGSGYKGGLKTLWKTYKDAPMGVSSVGWYHRFQNKFSGMPNSGTFAAEIREQHTEFKKDFASRWDPLRKLATELFGGADDAFSRLIKSSEFKTSLEKATTEGVIGIGASGTASLMSAQFRGNRFQFVRKAGSIWDEEVAAMKSVQSSVGPSVYSSGESFIDMEYFAGRAIGDVPVSELKSMKGLSEEVSGAFGELHKAGYRHGDPHLGNVILADTPSGKQIGLIDFGAAKKLSSYSPIEAIEQKATDIDVSIGGLKQLVEGQSSTFKPAFMNLSSNLVEEAKEELDLFDFAMDLGTKGEKFPAMPNSGSFAAEIREELTEFKKDFASRWDPLRKLSRTLFKGNKEKSAFKQLLDAPEFKSAISEAIKGKGKLLGRGMQGEVRGYTAKLALRGKEYEFGFATKRALSTEDYIKYKDELFEAAAGESAIVPPLVVRKNLANKNIRDIATEAKALSELGEDRAPSLYGTLGEDAILMERFQGVKELRKGPALTTKEHGSLESFIKSAHEKGYTHTDLHGNNIVRVTGEGGQSEVAVLDWGMANRFTKSKGVGGQSSDVWEFGKDIINEEAQKALGRSVNLQQYTQMADLRRLRAHLSKSSSAAEHGGINELVGMYNISSSPGANIQKVENQQRLLREAARAVFEGSKESGYLGLEAAKTARISPKVARTVAAKPEALAIKTIKQRRPKSETAFADTILQQNSIKNKSIDPFAQTLIQDTKRILKRNRKFQQASAESVGIGLRSAHKASKGHINFSSTTM